MIGSINLGRDSECYFNNSILLENTLLPYFCEAESLKFVNKKFFGLNYEKYLIYIQPHGIIETYNKDTKIIIKREHYKNGKREGLLEIFSDKSYTQPVLRKCFKNDEDHGLEESYYNNGNLRYKVNRKNGYNDGLYESWNSNGKPACRYSYKNGKHDGLYELWYDNGKLCIRCWYINGKLDGLCEKWNSDGHLLESTYWKDEVIQSQ
jgi:antitoxin component YwqK of YwqJK toxin-antitoxin module